MSTIRTGKPAHDGIELHRRLLSEYCPKLGLANYFPYIALKDKSKKLQKLIEKKNKEILAGFEKENKDMKESEKLLKLAATLDEDEEVQKKHDECFNLFKEAYDTLRENVNEMDGRALLKVKAIRGLSESQIKEAGKNQLIQIYTELQQLIEYRELNCTCFGKMLTKYRERCCVNSLLGQRRIQYVDQRVSQSCIALPAFDIDAQQDFIVSAYAMSFGMSFESALKEIQESSYMQYMSHRPRLLPTHDAFYFRPHTAFIGTGPQDFPKKILSGSASKILTKEICDCLRTTMLDTSIGTFANGEVNIKVNEAVRGKDVFVIQSLTKHAAASLSTVVMELMLVFQCLQLAAVGRATAVLPYLAYTNKTQEMSAISEMLQLMGCEHLMTVDMFNEQVEGFFDSIPVENLSAKAEFVKFITTELIKEGHSCQDIVVVAADSHTVARARAFADSLSQALPGAPYVGLATAVRRVRNVASSVEAHPSEKLSDGSFAFGNSSITNTTPSTFLNEVYLTGDVEGKMCIILDCILDEGLNLSTIANHLKRSGAGRIKAVITHALFSGDCAQRVAKCEIEEVIVSDSICQDDSLTNPELAKKLRVLPLAPLISEAIERVHTENTLSTLFDNRK